MINYDELYKAAEEGNAEAQYPLAIGIERSPEKAAEWLRKVAGNYNQSTSTS